MGNGQRREICTRFVTEEPNGGTFAPHHAVRAPRDEVGRSRSLRWAEREGEELQSARSRGLASLLAVVSQRNVAGRRAKRFRVPFTIPIAFLGGGFRFTGDLIDISSTGLLMRCDQDIELGTVGRMAIPVGYETSRVIAVATRRLPGVGMAFEFSHMTPHDRELLRRLLLRLAHTPEP